MSDFDRVLGAAGEVSKSQLPDGSYKRAVKMTPHERAEQANRVRWGGSHGTGAKPPLVRRSNGTTYRDSDRGVESVRPREPKTHYGSFRGAQGHPQGSPKKNRTGTVINRGLSDAFRGHGVQHTIAMARDAKTRPSKLHPNIEYGHTVTPKVEAKIDATIRPDIAGSLKHTVVFHHANLKVPGAQAAAAASHKTLLHGKGHVVIDAAAIDHHGNEAPLKPGITFAHVVNHELGHATAHHKSPARFDHPDGRINARRAYGEEARADVIGVKGPGVYRRSGVIGNRATAAIKRGIVTGMKAKGVKADSLPGAAPGSTWRDVHDSLGAHGHYNDVHRKARLGRDGIKGMSEQLKEGAHLNPGKYAIGAAAAVGVAHHEWKKHHVTNTADAAFSKARGYDESKHSRSHDGKFTPMNHAGLPDHVTREGWGGHTHHYVRVASNKKAFNDVYRNHSNVLTGYNSYIGGAYGAAGGAVGALKLAGDGPGKDGLIVGSAVAGGALGGVAAYKGTKAFLGRQAHKDKIQGKLDRRDIYARVSDERAHEYVGKAQTRPPSTSTGQATAGGAIVGGYAAGLTAAAGKNPERLSDLRAGYHNKMHARAVRNFGKPTAERSPEMRTKRGKYGAFEDLSPKAQKVVRTAAKLKHVAATDKQFQEAVPGLAGIAGAAVGGAALGAYQHHRRAQFKASVSGNR